MKLLSNGISYHAEIHSRKTGLPNLLLLHGFMGSGEGFTKLIGQLKYKSNPITIDLAGHGRTDTPTTDPERFTAEHQVNDLISILDRFRFNNFWLYGYSMGGRLSQHLYLKDPARFKGIILESTHCGITSKKARQQRRKVDEQRAQAIESDYPGFLDRWKSLSLFKGSHQTGTALYDSVMNQQAPSLIAASLRGFGAGTMPAVCNRISTIKCPTLLICGADDEKYVDKMREMNNLIRGSEYNIIERAGHRVHADQPNRITTLITKFFDNYA